MATVVKSMATTGVEGFMVEIEASAILQSIRNYMKKFQKVDALFPNIRLGQSQGNICFHSEIAL